MLPTNKLAKKATSLCEYAQAQNFALSYEHAVVIVALNPTRQNKTLLELAQKALSQPVIPPADLNNLDLKKQKAGTLAVSSSLVSDTAVDLATTKTATTAKSTRAAGKKATPALPSTSALPSTPSTPSIPAEPVKPAKPKLPSLSWEPKMVKDISQKFFVEPSVATTHNNLITKLCKEIPADAAMHLQPVEDFEDAEKFFSDLPAKANRLIKALDKQEPELSVRELLRTPVNTLVGSFEKVVDHYNQDKLTDADLVELVADYCGFVEVPFPKLIFKNLFTLVQENFPKCTEATDDWGESIYLRAYPASQAFNFALKYLLCSSGFNEHRLFGYYTVYAAAAHKLALLDQAGKIHHLDEYDLRYQENLDFLQEDEFVSCWFDLANFGTEFTKEWVQARLAGLQAELESSSTSLTRKNQIRVALKAALMRGIDAEVKATDAIAKIFKSSRKSPKWKYTLGTRIVKAYFASNELYSERNPDAGDLASGLYYRTREIWYELYQQVRHREGLKIEAEWRADYSRGHQDKVKWPSYDGQQIAVMSHEESIKAALKELMLTEEDVAFK